MKIETKYNIGDVVRLLAGNIPAHAKVEEIAEHYHQFWLAEGLKRREVV